MRCRTDADLVGWSGADGEDAIAFSEVDDLRAGVKAPTAKVDDPAIDAARAGCAAAAAHEDARVRTVQKQILRGAFPARCDETCLVLRKATAADRVQGARRGTGLFEDAVAVEPPRLSVPADAVMHFVRAARAPYAPLYKLLQNAGVALPVLREGNAVVAGLTNNHDKKLTGQAGWLRGPAEELVARMAANRHAGGGTPGVGYRRSPTAHALR